MVISLSILLLLFNKQNVKLNWSTETEVNNFGFEIERKAVDESKQSNWIKIGFIKGNGNSNSRKYYSFIDEPLGGKNFLYRLKQIDYTGEFTYSVEVLAELNLENNFVLHQNFPNPFNPETKIKFSIPYDSKVKLTLYNSPGEKVDELLNVNLSKGIHEYALNGKKYSSGYYLYNLTAYSVNGDKIFSDSKKMILIK